ncbi:FIST signal transduction protein [Ramlibacter algicola]|uniref:FIST C-terminal domain-containing protein n=1 Tax=Ramlibacter algicola TaxID=2795217 RepID=A0A934Q429_9BURK|nr:FIST N-terminal domain-containing protein [Ramlibacter algicola]MBK0394711.1 FIST C-terminal domain-containing protein [Ramlibacter algicola]
MNQTHISLTDTRNSEVAGVELGRGIREAFGGAPADAVVVFASAQHDYDKLLQALAAEAGTQTIVGSSSAGEFTNLGRGEGQVSALGIRSSDMKFAVGLGQGVSHDPAEAARQAIEGFRGRGKTQAAYRNALVMTDALAGHTDALVEELTVLTGGAYRFFGGGAGDDGRFHSTHVFAGTKAYSNAVSTLELLSDKPIGIGVAHGWQPAGPGLRVTQAEGTRLVGLNGAPAIEAIEEHAAKTGQRFDPADPLPFFLHNVLGIQSPGGYRLRVPLAVGENGAILCAAAVPEGAVVHIMKTDASSAVQAARQATEAALGALEGHKPSAAFVFDCVATRLRLGRAFEDELEACAKLLEPAGFVGCNTYGQIARAEGQFSGFHNCTAVVCVLPE